MEKLNTASLELSPRLIFTWVIGILGLVLAVTGRLSPDDGTKWLFFVTGASCLLITALLEDLMLFAILELILVCGTGALFADFNPIVRGALPILLSFQAIIFFALSGKLQQVPIFIASIGTFLLGLGFLVDHPLIHLFASLTIAIYAGHCFAQGARFAVLWLLLNTFFTITSVVRFVHSLSLV